MGNGSASLHDTHSPKQPYSTRGQKGVFLASGGAVVMLFSYFPSAATSLEWQTASSKQANSITATHHNHPTRAQIQPTVGQPEPAYVEHIEQRACKTAKYPKTQIRAVLKP